MTTEEGHWHEWAEKRTYDAKGELIEIYWYCEICGVKYEVSEKA
jgi:hypothetical protein